MEYMVIYVLNEGYTIEKGKEKRYYAASAASLSL